MLDSRRQLLRSGISLAAILSLPVRLCSGQGTHTQPQPVPSPNAPNPNFPNGMDGPPPTSAKNQRTMDKHTQEEIRSNVEKLYSLVSQMRQDLSVTSAASVLSVALVKQASDAEKLAKHIKDLAKG